MKPNGFKTFFCKIYYNLKSLFDACLYGVEYMQGIVIDKLRNLLNIPLLISNRGIWILIITENIFTKLVQDECDYLKKTF